MGAPSGCRFVWVGGNQGKVGTSVVGGVSWLQWSLTQGRSLALLLSPALPCGSLLPLPTWLLLTGQPSAQSRL